MKPNGKHPGMGVAVTLVLVLVAAVACGTSSAPTPAVDVLATAVAKSVAATVAASQPAAAPATQVATVTSSPTPAQPTDTAAPTKTPVPADTPLPTDTAEPTATPGPTDTPEPTPSPQPTITQTPRPGVGSVIKCGNDWAIKVVRPPSFAKNLNVLDTGGFLTFSGSEPAKGMWMLLQFELTNLQKKTDSLSMFGDELTTEGKLNDEWLSFTPSSWGTSRMQSSAGVSNYYEDIPPGITTNALAILDVNPSATDWKLAINTDRCEAEVYLTEDQAAASAEGGPIATIGRSAVNLRSGPGTNYGLVGKAAANQSYQIVGRNRDSSWWQICCDKGQKAWVAASVATALGPTANVPMPENIPTPLPVPTAAPRPTAVPLSRESAIGKEFLTTLWGLKLYDVKRAKVVYHFGDADIAHGTWLIPFVEVRNLGSGTAQPNRNLHYYLQDAGGRTFTYDPFNDGVLGAAWQFKAGHLYDNINPGSVLGVALPYDVAPDLGDVWLRVKEAPGVVMYLGNISQMEELK